MIGTPPSRRAAVQRLALPFLVLLSGTIIILGKADQVMIEALRVSVTDTASPVLDVLSRPLAFLGQIGERTQEFFNVYRENGRLRELLKLTPDPAATFITARVIASSGGAYVRSLMVRAGSENGVARGQ